MSIGAFAGELTQDYQAANNINCPANVSINTEGAWTQLLASTDFDACGFWLGWITNDSTILNAEGLLDIGVGANPNEVAIVADLSQQWASASGRQMSGYGWFPVQIPAGTRISGRSQATTASLGILVEAIVMCEGTTGFPECTTFGATAATSDGTDVDPGASAGTKGAWREFSASTPHDIVAISYGITRDAADRALSIAKFQIDIGVGANPNEVVVVPDLPGWQQSSQDINFPAYSGPIPCYIPAGSRLVARCSSDINTAGDRVIGLILYGFGG